MPEEKKKDQEQESEETTEVEETEEETTEEETEETETQEVEEESEETEEDDELDIERAKAKIAKANTEAKGLRKKLRDAEEKLKNAKTPEEVEEIVSNLTRDRETAERELLAENVALTHKLPKSLAKRLSGSTREELEADAKELAELFGTEDEDEDITLEGGLNPRNRSAGDDDPRTLAQKHGHRRKR